MDLAQQALSVIVGQRRKRKTENRYLSLFNRIEFAASYCSPLGIIIRGQKDNRVLIMTN
ncbi:hypothetical protein GGD64_005380 [Bradyrhizobium sp. CIR3A]|nr:hypothetical protein [Bradyrhizobium sp. CIR3A]